MNIDGNFRKSRIKILLNKTKEQKFNADLHIFAKMTIKRQKKCKKLADTSLTFLV